MERKIPSSDSTNDPFALVLPRQVWVHIILPELFKMSVAKMVKDYKEYTWRKRNVKKKVWYNFCQIAECSSQVMQLICDHLDLFLIWNCRPQNLSLSSRQSPWKIEVLPQPEGYQTQRSTQQPGFPSHYVIALMEGVSMWGRGGEVQPSCQNQAICQVRTNRSGGEQAQSQAVAAQQWGHLATSEEIRALPGALLFYLWSSCLNLHFTDNGKQEIKEFIFLVRMD